MILRNYHNILVHLCMGYDGVKNSVFGDGSLEIKSTTGAIAKVRASSRNYAYFFPIATPYTLYNGAENLTATGQARLIFGYNDTAVTYDDYTLGNECTYIEKSAVTASDLVYDEATRKYSRTVTCNLTNSSTNSDVNLKEMGIMVVLDTDNNGSAGGTPVLLYREVLETPIAIPKGDAVKYTHTFEFTMPTVG